FLEACGLDWETIVAGTQLDRESGESYFAFQEPLVKELASYGSERAASLLAEMARRAKPDRWQAYTCALTAFVARNPSNPAECPAYERIVNTIDSDTVDRVSRVRISPAMQKE